MSSDWNKKCEQVERQGKTPLKMLNRCVCATVCIFVLVSFWICTQSERMIYFRIWFVCVSSPNVIHIKWKFLCTVASSSFLVALQWICSQLHVTIYTYIVLLVAVFSLSFFTFTYRSLSLLRSHLLAFAPPVHSSTQHSTHHSANIRQNKVSPFLHLFAIAEQCSQFGDVFVIRNFNFHIFTSSACRRICACGFTRICLYGLCDTVNKNIYMHIEGYTLDMIVFALNAMPYSSFIINRKIKPTTSYLSWHIQWNHITQDKFSSMQDIC